ncbi:MAG: CDP-glucose 4,6-dehydratase [Bacteroidales bacterium]|nr:CDP-glucose 4,6-dehydratase [Bacteroidales bacterium]
MGINDILNSYKGKKVLVTGYTGFKGSWLSIWLNSIGAKVIGIGLEPKTKYDNYVLAQVDSFVKEYFVDIRNFEKTNAVFEKEQPEIVFHLAAQPLVLESYQNPRETFETNTLGTANILEAVRMSDSVTTAIMITTDKVYENKEWIWPYRENERLGGYDPYSASKGAAEIVISSYRNSFFNINNYQSHKKAVASVRAGNVIGGGDWAENRIIPDCIRALEKSEAIFVRNPKATRPWQHVLEPLGGYLQLGARLMEEPEKFAEAWNFGPKIENITNVGELVEILITKYGKGTWIDGSKPDALHEATLLALDINKAKYKLGWQPLLNLEQTIELTVNWYKNYADMNVCDICLQQIADYTKLWKLQSVN